MKNTKKLVLGFVAMLLVGGNAWGMDRGKKAFVVGSTTEKVSKTKGLVDFGSYLIQWRCFVRDCMRSRFREGVCRTFADYCAQVRSGRKKIPNCSKKHAVVRGSSKSNRRTFASYRLQVWCGRNRIAGCPKVYSASQNVSKKKSFHDVCQQFLGTTTILLNLTNLLLNESHRQRLCQNEKCRSESFLYCVINLCLKFCLWQYFSLALRGLDEHPYFSRYGLEDYLDSIFGQHSGTMIPLPIFCSTAKQGISCNCDGSCGQADLLEKINRIVPGGTNLSLSKVFS